MPASFVPPLDPNDPQNENSGAFTDDQIQEYDSEIYQDHENTEDENPLDPVVFFDPWRKPVYIVDIAANEQSSNDIVNTTLGSDNAPHKESGVLIPKIQLGNQILRNDDIVKFSLDYRFFMPTLHLEIKNSSGDRRITSTITENSVIRVIFRPHIDGRYKKIAWEFSPTAQNYVKNRRILSIDAKLKFNPILNPPENSILNGDGIINFPGYTEYIINKETNELTTGMEIESTYGVNSKEVNCWKALYSCAEDMGLGFSASPGCIDDENSRVIFVQNRPYYLIIQDIVRSLGDENHIYDAWIDPYGYLVLVNLSHIWGAEVDAGKLFIDSTTGIEMPIENGPHKKYTKVARVITNYRKTMSPSDMQFVDDPITICNYNAILTNGVKKIIRSIKLEDGSEKENAEYNEEENTEENNNVENTNNSSEESQPSTSPESQDQDNTEENVKAAKTTITKIYDQLNTILGVTQSNSYQTLLDNGYENAANNYFVYSSFEPKVYYIMNAIQSYISVKDEVFNRNYQLNICLNYTGEGINENYDDPETFFDREGLYFSSIEELLSMVDSVKSTFLSIKDDKLLHDKGIYDDDEQNKEEKSNEQNNSEDKDIDSGEPEDDNSIVTPEDEEEEAPAANSLHDTEILNQINSINEPINTTVHSIDVVDINNSGQQIIQRHVSKAYIMNKRMNKLRVTMKGINYGLQRGQWISVALFDYSMYDKIRDQHSHHLLPYPNDPEKFVWLVRDLQHRNGDSHMKFAVDEEHPVQNLDISDLYYIDGMAFEYDPLTGFRQVLDLIKRTVMNSK